MFVYWIIHQYQVPYLSHAILRALQEKKTVKKKHGNPAASSAAMCGKLHGTPAASSAAMYQVWTHESTSYEVKVVIWLREITVEFGRTAGEAAAAPVPFPLAPCLFHVARLFPSIDNSTVTKDPTRRCSLWKRGGRRFRMHFSFCLLHCASASNCIHCACWPFWYRKINAFWKRGGKRFRMTFSFSG